MSVISPSPEVRWSSDADRPGGVVTGELPLAQDATERGTALLRAGHHQAEVTGAGILLGAAEYLG